jgi:sec-independent protein translocase protein TatC
MAETISNKKRNKSPEAEMSFWEHLEVLRWLFIRSAIAIVVFATVAFIYKDIIFDNIILAPKSPGFATNAFFCWLGDKLSLDYLCINNLNLKIINTDMSGQLTVHLYVSLIAGIVLAFPYLLWEIFRFIKPALKAHEKKYSTQFIIVTTFLFLTGVLFSYFLVVPLTVNFLGSYQVSANIENYIALNSYISTVTTLSLATGLVFELPVFVYFLTKIGILKPVFLQKNRKIIIVIILIVGAIITPPDVFSQLMVSIPLYGLYEFSIYVSLIVYRRKMRKEAAISD